MSGGVGTDHRVLWGKQNVACVAEEMTFYISLTFELDIGVPTYNPAFGRWRLTGLEFKANFSYILSLTLD